LTEREKEEVQRYIEEQTGQKVGPSFLEWTLEYRHIRDKAAGEVKQFSLRDYPWLEHVYNLIGDLQSDSRVVIKKAAQIGATELALNYAFYTLDGRGNVFYALPPGPTQGNFAHARVDPAIGASPHILEMAGNVDNVGLKTFSKGLNLYIRGTSVPKGDPSRAAQLSEAPADVAIIDEFDRVPPAAVPLIRDRLGDSRLRIEIDLSTPTYPDIGIDAEYIGTTMHEPKIQCQECDAWSWLDWTLVRGPVEDDPHARIVCPLCHKAIDREGMWSQGRCKWVARHPKRAVVGVWIPKLVSERADLDEMWENSQAKRDIDRQAFWNGDMGLPYEPKGSRLTREIIAACASPIEVYPTFPQRARWCAMGVDVGLELHVWIKERTEAGRERTVWAGSVLEWSDLDRLMVQYGVQRCVVDDQPELRLDVEFQNRHRGKVWLAQYIENAKAELATWQRGRGIVKMERTKALDEASAKMRLGIDELPADWENTPDILKHLSASIKAKKVLEDGSTIYHFPRTGKPDHLHHAKAYCEAALSILPPDPGGPEQRGGEEVPAAGRSRYHGMGRSPGGSMRGRL
jgi:hypothetical protein